MQISARVNLIRSFGPGNARDDAQHVVQIDPVAGLEMPGYCLGTNSRQADLPLRIIGIYEINVERDLPVDADRLNFLDERGTNAL